MNAAFVLPCRVQFPSFRHNGNDEECGNAENGSANNTSVRTRPISSSSLANVIPRRTETFDEGGASDLSSFLAYCVGCSATFCSSLPHRHPFTRSERNVDLRHDTEDIRISSLRCPPVSHHIDWRVIERRIRDSFVWQSTAYVSSTFTVITLPYLVCTWFVCFSVYRHRAHFPRYADRHHRRA